MSFNGGLHKWRCDTIEVEIPGNLRVKFLAMGGADVFVTSDLCTSSFRVVKESFMAPDSMSLYTGSMLEIPYSIRQLITVEDDDANDPIVQDKYLTQLAATSSSSETIEFTVTKEIADNPNVLLVLQDALEEWSCKSGINWGIYYVTDQTLGEKGDGINTIYYDPALDATTTLGNARDTSIVCSSANAGEHTEYDFAIQTEFGGADYNQAFFTVLHELGHLHGLGHTKPLPGGEPDLMKRFYDPSDDTSFTIDDITAANIVSDRSEFNIFGPEINLRSFGDYGMRNNINDSGSEPDTASINTSIETGERLDIYH